MKFHRIIGKELKENKALVASAEANLSKVFLDLAIKPQNVGVGSNMGGDPLVFSLIYPMQHVATMNIPTAATDGKRYYWNPEFINSKSKIGLRLICAHEAWHAIYMHPQRRGSRHPKLWNIAVDFIVNWTCMQDMRSRNMDCVEVFRRELGNFVTLEAYANHIKDPFKPIQGAEDWKSDLEIQRGSGVPLQIPNPNDDRELTKEEKKMIKKLSKAKRYFFSDPDLPEDLRKPEKIYDYLWNLIPKCPECNKVGMYKLPKPSKDSKKSKDKKEDNNDSGDSGESEDKDKKDESKAGSHDHGNGSEPCDCPNPHSNDDQNTSDQQGDGDEDGQSPNGGGSDQSCDHKGCGTCGDGEHYDIFDFGDTLDEHMDADGSPEDAAKKLASAVEAAKKMAGSVPAGLEEELGQLFAPKIRWQDFLRAKISKVTDGNSKNDWTRFKSRPIFAGIMKPKRVTQVCRFGVLLDTSGSMSQQDMAYGISQLQSLNQRSEGWIVCGDADIYWDKAVKIKSANAAELSRIKPCGRGGTRYAQFFTEYKQKVGDADFLVVITDGYLDFTDVSQMVDPGVPVYWLITNGSDFSQPFGKSFNLID